MATQGVSVIVAEEVPVEAQVLASEKVAQTKPKRVAKSKAKAKAKGKAKGKAKCKAKAKGIVKAEAQASDAAPKDAKPKALGLKAKILAEVGERDVDEVIAETKQQIAELQKTVSNVNEEEGQFDAEIRAAKNAYEASSAKVEEAKAQEAVAFEKVKIAREEAVGARKTTLEAQTGRGDAEMVVALLELEVECNVKVKDLQDAKDASAAAAEAAKKALEEAKRLESEAGSAAKTAVAEVRSKENESLKAIDDRQLAVYDQNKAAKGQGKGLARELNAEMKELEKRREEREKVRTQKLKEVMSSSKSKRAGNEASNSPAKMARAGGS